MKDLAGLAWIFEEKRPRLRALAYRMLGSTSEAEDAVQEAWIRLGRLDDSAIGNLSGWLTAVVGRVCLDVLRKRKSRREEPIEAHVPDLIVTPEDRPDPEQEALIADAVGIALLIVLETLSPSERLAFVLHDMFAVPFEEIAPIMGCSLAAARKSASRGRLRVRGASHSPDVDVKQQRRVVDAFFAAVREGNFNALVAILDPDIVVRSDHGTPQEIRGARIAAQGALMFANAAQWVEPVLVNGAAGVISRLPGGRLFAVMCFIVKGGRIVQIDVIRDPARLNGLDLTSLN
jgi:RNA polymerase sigma-70 factor (ECF subfamily)